MEGIYKQTLEQLDAADAELLDSAFEAAASAYAPHSKFHVGAAARLSSGRLVVGSNQENVAFPSGLCAERVAAFAAGAQFPNDSIEVMAIVTTNGEKVLGGFSPCGGCRQVLFESEERQEQPIRLILQGGRDAEIMEVTSAAVLLSLAFKARGLGED